MLTWWLVETRGPLGDHRTSVFPLGVGHDGLRSAQLERAGSGLFTHPAGSNGIPTFTVRQRLLHEKIEPMLERELQHRQVVPAGDSYAAKLIGWVEVGVETSPPRIE